jgi:molecular chaperone GrpE
MMTDKEQNAAAAEAAHDARPGADDEHREDGGPGAGPLGADDLDGPDARRDAGDPRDAEVAALKDRHLRLAAEFDNYRKRVERERSEGAVRAQAQLVERLLEPLDDLERIAGFDAESTESSAVKQAAEMVQRKLLRALEAAGLEGIDARDRPFDPNVHEALTTVPAASPDEDNTVAEVYQAGYRFKGVLLRPARVVVKKH